MTDWGLLAFGKGVLVRVGCIHLLLPSYGGVLDQKRGCISRKS